MGSWRRSRISWCRWGCTWRPRACRCLSFLYINGKELFAEAFEGFRQGREGFVAAGGRRKRAGNFGAGAGDDADTGVNGESIFGR